MVEAGIQRARTSSRLFVFKVFLSVLGRVTTGAYVGVQTTFSLPLGKTVQSSFFMLACFISGV
jgi:hypothetical protein